jgi:antitoxin YefM
VKSCYGTVSRTTQERPLFMAITASQARAQLFPLIEQVNEDMKPVVITSKAGNAVLISQSEYEAMIETAYLLSTPANREWLLESLAQADRGELIPLELPIKALTVVPKATKKSK